MSITVHIPTLLRTLTLDRKRVEGTGATVREVIESLENAYPGIQGRLVSDGRVHRFMNLYLNDEDIRFANDLATPVRPGDTLTILPAVAGGSGAPAC
ncbi:MoaD/ThiS family protein [Paracidovorax anthurii]|uniref:Molybdopterin synthase subunit MoaD n=1 Tax=Paracidovorax anthurii TaxID=78229 RepID=A0A328YXL8_9BURK|nr:MoaD/ThiS family protein [Paracidovorax anthurii]RAR75297.1 molybdopterin synthase subunit MoaD [Paracidovorax anthurii]